MIISPDTEIAQIAATNPATIKVFQQHQIDFCCGGRIPLAEACARQGIDPDVLLDELCVVGHVSDATPDWETASLSSLIQHIQTRYHVPLREELPRLAAMLRKLVQRHGDRLPDVLPALLRTFEALHDELLSHMARQDTVLFPNIEAAEAIARETSHRAESWRWIEHPIDIMEDEHASAGARLATIRELTGGYVAPADACPTFRGLYYGLAELEREMHVHVHLENNILFPRAVRLTRPAAD
jgi:regulator of cell morphogenesis and NO signaling